MNLKGMLPIVVMLLCVLSSPAKAKKRVMLIGFDGVQYEQLQRLHTPNFDRLTIRKAYAGGIKGDSNQQATSNGAGWSTVLTGVWANKHHVVTNSSGIANPEFPSLFRRLHDYDSGLSMASIVHWPPIHRRYFIRDLPLIHCVKTMRSDGCVTKAAIKEINDNTDFIFLHFNNPDTVGHLHGFGPKYDRSLKYADKRLGYILNAIQQSEQNTDSEWLVLVTTDHGRTPFTGANHGNQTTSEKTVFIASNVPLNEEFSTQAIPLNKDFSGLYGYAAQTSLAATILDYFGVPLSSGWQLDGPSLYSPIGVRKLMKESSGELTWVSDSDQSVLIFKNRVLVGTVRANTQHWRDPEPTGSGVTDYVLLLNDNPVAYRLEQ